MEINLPSYGGNHVESLHVTGRTCGKEVPRVLIDNGPAMNILPLKMLGILGLDVSQVKSSGHCVRAYDCTSR